MYFRLCGTAIALLTLSLLGCEQQYVCIASDSKTCDRPVDLSMDFSGTTVDIAANPIDMARGPLGVNAFRRYLLTDSPDCGDMATHFSQFLYSSFTDPTGARLNCYSPTKTCTWRATIDDSIVSEPVSTNLEIGFNFSSYSDAKAFGITQVCFTIDGKESCESIGLNEPKEVNNMLSCPSGLCWKLRRSFPGGYGYASVMTLKFACQGFASIQNPELTLRY